MHSLPPLSAAQLVIKIIIAKAVDLIIDLCSILGSPGRLLGLVQLGLLLSALAALKFAGVPLTAFTILGGAAAVGLGFGSQNIVSNFVSGLILLAERPVRPGDIIQVDGNFATVDHIGARSTRVRTGSNLDIVVPNSKFLENNVVNWTLTDNHIRCQIDVGVAYGSPCERVPELLIKAAKMHELVLVDPAPYVWFTDFGESALQFKLNFWIQVYSISRRMGIETEVRFNIVRLFEDAGIQMPFPQRDIHVNPQQPVPVRVVERRAA